MHAATAMSEPAIPDPSALLEGVSGRDRESLARLVALFDADLLRFALIVSGDPEQARDAVQDTWLRVWRHPPRLRHPERLRSWLLTVAANEAKQAKRRQRRREVLERLRPGGATHESPRNEEMVDVRTALDRLSDRDRELVALRYVLGLTSQEIARNSSLTPEGVRTRLRRALLKLREDLSDA